jgi:hypothetical protein
MPEGICRLCGKAGPLTEEHVPPEGAFNDAKVLFHRMRHVGGQILRYAEDKPRGNTLAVLCRRCNSRTGSVYGTEYVRFVKEVANRADGKRHGEHVQFTTRTFPLRIVKQVLTTLSATSGELGPEMPFIRRFLEDRLETGLPSAYRLFAFVPEVRGLGRTTGVGAFLNLEDRQFVVYSENTWWPLGWILTLNGEPIHRAREVTDWAASSFRDRRTVDVDLPVLSALGDYGADFRTSEQIQRDRMRNLGLL